jgi:hypothetical protein
MRKYRHFIPMLLLVSLCVVPSGGQGQQTTASNSSDQLGPLLSRLGARIQRYTDEITGLSWTETVRTEDLDENLKPKGKAKEYVYEVIVTRRPSAQNPQETTLLVARTLKTLDGKPQKESDLKRSRCRDTNPRPVYRVPLDFLLPAEQSKYVFSLIGESELRGQKTLVVSVFSVARGETPTFKIEDNCLRLTGALPMEGRLWIDPKTEEIIQISWQLENPVEGKAGAGVSMKGPFIVFRPSRGLRYERNETTTQFMRLDFQNPDQTLLVPRESETLSLLRGASHPGFHSTTKYTEFKRFLTDVKVKETQ